MIGFLFGFLDQYKQSSKLSGLDNNDGFDLGLESNGCLEGDSLGDGLGVGLGDGDGLGVVIPNSLHFWSNFL